MPMLDWLVGFGVDYSDGGAPEKVKALATAGKDAADAFLKLQTAADRLATSLGKVDRAAEAADVSVSALAAAFGAAASGAYSAAGASDAAASGFRRAATAARDARRATADAARGAKEYAEAWRSASVSLGVPALAGGAFGSQLALPAPPPLALPWTQQIALGGGSAAAAMALAAGSDIPALGPGLSGVPAAWMRRHIPGGYSAGGAITPYGFNPPGMDGGGYDGSGWGAGGPRALPSGGAIIPYEQVLRARPIPRQRFPWARPSAESFDWMKDAAGDFNDLTLKYGVKAAKTAAKVTAAEAIDSIYEAGKFQQILLSIQNVTGANAATMSRVRQSSFDVGSMSGTSASESAEMFREIARQSAGAMSVNDMLGLLPQAAKMQVVLGATRGFSPTQTVDNTLALVHLFRQYDPKGQPKMMDTVLRMAELMPSNLSQAVTQMTYFLPTLKNLKVTDEDAASLMVALSRFGMGRGKGGTSIANLASEALGPLQLTKHAQQGKAGLLGPKGLNVLDEHGNSRYFTEKGGDIFGFLDALAAFEKKNGSIAAQTTFKSAFGTVGSRVADLMANPVIIDQLHKIHDAIKEQKSLGLDSQANTIFGSQNFAAHRAWSNFQSLATEIGTLAIPGVTKGFNDLGDSLHNAQVWLHKHADVEKKIKKEIYDDVVGIEKYIVDHRKDWQELGGDIVWAAKQAKAFAPALEMLGDVFLRQYEWIFKIAKLDKKITGNDHPLPVTGNAPTAKGDLKRWAYFVLTGDPGAPATSTPPSTPPHGGREKMRREVHITLDVKGGDEVTRDHIRQHVRRVLKEEISDHRSFGATSGSIVTNPRSASIHSTTQHVR
jgi:hypothetical protein